MRRQIAAILRKEWITVRPRRWNLALFLFTFSSLYALSGHARLKSGAAPVTPSSFAEGYAIYAGAFITLLCTLTTLRFWQELSSHTVESLLALPISLTVAFAAKCALAVTVGSLCGYLGCAAVFVSFAPWVTLGTAILCRLPLLLVLFPAVAFGSSCIIGFTMWSMSETAAKFAQMGIVASLAAGFGLALSGFATSAALPILAVIGAFMLTLGMVLVARLDKERIVLNEA